MLLVILIILSVSLVLLSFYLEYRDPYSLSYLPVLILGICAVAAVIILSSVSAANHIDSDGTAASNRQRYDALVYQAEHNLYDNDNDLGKKEMVDQIQEWNEDLAYYQQTQDDLWIGFLYPNIYDQFEYIPMDIIQ